MKRKKIQRKMKIEPQVKIYDLRDMLEYIDKNFKRHPHLDVVKWMEKHGR